MFSLSPIADIKVGLGLRFSIRSVVTSDDLMGKLLETSEDNYFQMKLRYKGNHSSDTKLVLESN